MKWREAESAARRRFPFPASWRSGVLWALLWRAFTGLMVLGAAQGMESAAPPLLSRIGQWEVTDHGLPHDLGEHAVERVERVGWNDQWVPVSPWTPDQAAMHLNEPPRTPPESRLHVARWGVSEGLPHAKVRALARTADGFLWVGTAAGVARFDGHRFRLISPSGAFSIRALHVDAQDRVWVGTDQGLHCIRNGQWSDVPEAVSLKGVVVHDLADRRLGGLWIASEQGVAALTADRFEPLAVPGLDAALSVIEPAQGSLWIGSRHGLFDVEALTGTVLNRALATVTARDGNVFDDVEVWDLLQGSDGVLWIGTTYGVWVQRPARKQVEPLSDILVRGVAFPGYARLARDFAGAIWATSQSVSGVGHYAQSGDAIAGRRVLTDLEGTRCVLADPGGALWIGSDRGLVQVQQAAVDEFSLKVDLPLNGQWSVHPAHEGGLWMATQVGGHTLVSHWSEATLRIYSLPSTILRFNRLSFLQSLASDGGVAGTRLRWRSPSAPQSIGTPKNLPGPVAWTAVAVDPSSTAYVATADGLFRFATDGPLERISSVPACDVQALHVDGEGGLWIASRDRGLCLFHAEQFSQIAPSDSVRPVLSLAGSSHGRLWVGFTNGFGMYQDGVLRGVPLDAHDGPLRVEGLIEDRQGDLWLNHSRGLARVRAADLSLWRNGIGTPVPVTLFGDEDGLKLLEMGTRGPTAAMTRDGRLWFGRRGGVATVDPEQLPPAAPPPRVALESVNAAGVVHPADGDLSLTAPQSRPLQFQFAVAALPLPDRWILQHRLEGLESDWQESDKSRLATYPNLNPGTYKFRVRVRNHEGRWGNEETLQVVRIHPPLWRTPQAMAGGGLVLAGAFGAILRWRAVCQKRRADLERDGALQRERHRLARDLHDHLGARLAEEALTRPDDAESERLSREVLGELKDLIWSVHPSNDSLASLAEFVVDFSTRFLEKAGLELDLRVADQIPDIFLPGEFRRDVSAMLKEALRNVVSHSGARRVTVTFEAVGGGILLAVHDDGRGFREGDEGRPASPSGGGHGLHNLRDRTAAIGGRMEIVSAPGHGTEIRFHLPIHSPAKMKP